MGLAPYGQPTYVELILDKLLDFKEDGAFRLDMQYLNYCTGLTMTNSRFDEIFGGPPRKRNGDSHLSADRMHGSYLGPEYSPGQIQAELDAMGATYTVLDDHTLFSKVA